MLKNIPPILSPELLKIMREMGHGDTIVLVDANYPATTGAKRLVRLDGVEMTDLLDAMLQFLPIDAFVANPIAVMQPDDKSIKPPIWQEFLKVISKRDDEKAFTEFDYIDRMDFYGYAKEAYALVQTGTTAHYANIGIKKGVL